MIYKRRDFVNLHLVKNGPNESRRINQAQRIERSREIYEAIAADAAACGLNPKHF
jgi:hypothetical protein